MKTLTNRILSILTKAPQTSTTIWDCLSDSSVRLADVRRELNALCDEGHASREATGPMPTVYRLAAQAVAS